MRAIHRVHERIHQQCRLEGPFGPQNAAVSVKDATSDTTEISWIGGRGHGEQRPRDGQRFDRWNAIENNRVIDPVVIGRVYVVANEQWSVPTPT